MLRGFHATSLSIYDFSTLYTALPHNLIKKTFKIRLSGLSKVKVLHTWPVTKEMRSLLLNTNLDINFGRVKICVKIEHIF